MLTVPEALRLASEVCDGVLVCVFEILGIVVLVFGRVKWDVDFGPDRRLVLPGTAVLDVRCEVECLVIELSPERLPTLILPECDALLERLDTLDNTAFEDDEDE